jgi:hypothetical protein
MDHKINVNIHFLPLHTVFFPWGCCNQYHKFDGLKQQDSFSYIAGGQKSKIKGIDSAMLPLKPLYLLATQVFLGLQFKYFCFHSILDSTVTWGCPCMSLSSLGIYLPLIIRISVILY